MMVHQLAARAGVSAHAVRYYTRIGLLHPRREARNGYKSYSDMDLHRVIFIRRAQGLGFGLSDITEIIRHSTQNRSPCPLVREIIERRLHENGDMLNELLALRERMQRAVRKWRRMPDRLPDGREICHLIESA